MLPLPTKDCDVVKTPYQRYGHTVVEYKGNAFLWGGRNDSAGACNILYKFDSSKCTFSILKYLLNIQDVFLMYSRLLIIKNV